MSRKQFTEGKDELKHATVWFRTTAATEDIDMLILTPRDRPIRVIDARLMFFALDTFDSGVDIDLEKDDGTTETEFANYDTVGGGTPTAVSTIYSFTFSGDGKIPVGSWLQLHVDDDEDAACGGVVEVDYVELEA